MTAKKTTAAQLTAEEVKTAPEASAAPEAVKQYIYLGPNHPRGLLVNSTIFKGGVPAEVEAVFEKCPSAKALLVETSRAAKNMQALRKADSAQVALYKQADKELHDKGV